MSFHLVLHYQGWLAANREQLSNRQTYRHTDIMQIYIYMDRFNFYYCFHSMDILSIDNCVGLIKNKIKSMISKCYSSKKLIALNTIHEVDPSGTHFTAESTDAMQIKCLAQGHNILISGFVQSTSVTRNRYSNHYTNMLYYRFLYFIGYKYQFPNDG